MAVVRGDRDGIRRSSFPTRTYTGFEDETLMFRPISFTKVRMDSSSSMVLLMFVLSGAAGLIYEVVWARQLVLVFGNTTQAVSAILTGFFGGMAVGSVVGGR